MTTDEKLKAILAAVQKDPGGRGLAKDPLDNLFTACAGDFALACHSIANHSSPAVEILTGFFIPTVGSFETDGPLGVVFLTQVLAHLGIPVCHLAEAPVMSSILAGLSLAGCTSIEPISTTHTVAIERAGPAADGKHYTMRGKDITSHLDVAYTPRAGVVSIGVGDGGNEVGMGKVSRETICKNIPNGERIHCNVATDYLVVAGVSNWGAYALATGLLALKGVPAPPGLYDAARERDILQMMIREGLLVDGVTGKQTATVDGLPWDVYAKPLSDLAGILEG